MFDELRRCLALRLPHRFEDARLRDSAEIVVDGRGPAGCPHVEVHRAGQRVGVSEAPRAAAPRLMHGVDAQRSAMREQRRLAVAVERHQRVPEIILGLGQLLRPLLMARLDRLGRGGVGESRRLGDEGRALGRDLQAGG